MILNFEVPAPSAQSSEALSQVGGKKKKDPRHLRLKRKREQRREERKLKKAKKGKNSKGDRNRGTNGEGMNKINASTGKKDKAQKQAVANASAPSSSTLVYGPVRNTVGSMGESTDKEIVITNNNFHIRTKKSDAVVNDGSAPYGSRKNPKSVKRTDVLDSARNALKHVKKSQNPIDSQPSNHLFENTSPWIDLGIDKRLVRHIETEGQGLGMKKPTMVQSTSIPIILSHLHDVVIKSETGSGKTLTYLLPIAQVLTSISPRISRKDGSLALILVPTRELGTQVLSVAQKLFRPFPWIIPGMICGGEKAKAEKARLRKGLSVLVATPGRLLYHLNSTKSFVTAGLQFLVLDEADRMMDQGFEQQLKDIFEILRYKKTNEDTYNYTGSIKPWRTILVSATQKANVTSLCGVDLVEPKFIDASIKKSSELIGAYDTPKQLSQHVVLLDSSQKLVALLGFIRHRFREAKKLPMKMKKCHLLIFFSTCASVDFHYSLFNKAALLADSEKELTNMGKRKKHDRNRNLPNAKNIVRSLSNRVYRLHGNIEQRERNQTLQSFSKNDFGVLFCTDVAARGLDIPNVDWIVQYDAPSETTEYVHRVGRTARSGKAGSALLFLRPCEASFIKYLESFKLNLTQVSSISVLGGLCNDDKGVIGGSRRGELAKERANECQLFLERLTANSSDLKSLASKAFQSWVGSYSCREKSTRSIFNVRMLHLGHIAKSFSLRDAPSSIGKPSGNKAKHSKKM